MNEQNLIANTERTPSEIRKRNRKAGIKSGEVRRQRKSQRELIETYGSAIIKKDGKEKINPISGEPLTYNEQVALNVLFGAADDDIDYIKLFLELKGELKNGTTFNQQINIDGRKPLSIREARAKLLGKAKDEGDDK